MHWNRELEVGDDHASLPLSGLVPEVAYIITIFVKERCFAER